MTPAPFYIGQEVVALVTKRSGYHPEFGITKGETYIVKAMKYCCSWRVNIGCTYPDQQFDCSRCGAQLDNSCLFFSTNFAPKEEFPANLEKEIEEALTRQLELKPELV